MKIITWNCNGAFRKKFEKIKEIYADIYVIQEAEDPCYVDNKDFEYHKFVSNYFYKGNKNKGLLVILHNKNLHVKENNWDDLLMNYYMSLNVDKLKLSCIWANDCAIEDVCNYIRINYNKIDDNSIFVGDFNSSVNFNYKHLNENRNHAALNQMLLNKNLVSCYHEFFNEKHGRENIATFYMYKKEDKKYHIDYCYCNKDYIKDVKIYDYNNWIKFSDHMPLYIEIDY